MAAVPELRRASGVEPRAAPEAAATHALYERYARQIYGFCYQQLGSREEAEDAVQTTFLNAFRGLSRGVSPEAEAAWLYKIAHNVCLTRRRAAGRRRRVEAPSDIQALQDFVAAPQRMGADELIELQEALAAMPSSQRKAILLREWRGLSYCEIADELELTQSAVETLIFRARRSLARGLEAAPDEQRRVWGRLRQGMDVGSLLGVLKTLVSGGAAAKAVATAAAVTSTAVVAAVPGDERVPRRGQLDVPPPAAQVAEPAAAKKSRPAPARAAPAAAEPRPARAVAAKPRVPAKQAPVVERAVAPTPVRQPPVALPPVAEQPKPVPSRRPSAVVPFRGDQPGKPARSKPEPRPAVAKGKPAPPGLAGSSGKPGGPGSEPPGPGDGNGNAGGPPADPGKGNGPKG